MKPTAKFIVLNPKPTANAVPHRAWISIIAFLILVTLAFTRLTMRDAATGRSDSEIPEPVLDALIHYASSSHNASGMTTSEVKYIRDVLSRCAAPCNILVFGLTHETLLWHSLNLKGRTVFIDESRYLVEIVEKKHPFVEAYDVIYLTKASELYYLIEYFKAEVTKECHPRRSLLFSECKLAVNDLPNELYEVDWDVILVDGPRGYVEEGPGRIAAIYTAGVLARNRSQKTDVFVHEIDREVERVSSAEFLCEENLVETTDMLGHFVIGKFGVNPFGFCSPSSSAVNVSPQ